MVYNPRARLCAARALTHKYIEEIKNVPILPIPATNLDWELLCNGGKGKCNKRVLEDTIDVIDASNIITGGNNVNEVIPSITGIEIQQQQQ
jgi:hypothetical protein